MKVILHIGAHRTAATSYQHYLAENASRLHLRGLHAIGPGDTCDTLMSGISAECDACPAQGRPDHSSRRIERYLSRLSRDHVTHLLISDESLAGSVRRNLHQHGLYKDLGERMTRLHMAFDGRIDRVVLCIRSQEGLWASALASSMAHGHRLPDPDVLERLSRAPRSWRDVILDLACALPGVEIQVMPYEIFGGLPERLLEHMTGLGEMPRFHARAWLSKSPNRERLRQILACRGDERVKTLAGAGRWQPFGSDQIAALREAYADDLFWLRAGAEGLARIVEETGPVRTGDHPAPDLTTRGRSDGTEERHLA